MRRRIPLRPSSLLSALPLPLSLLARAAPHGVASFVYHIVSDEPVPHVRHLYPFKTTGRFEADLDLLSRAFELVDYARLLEGIEGTRPLPPNAAVLTFDDGFAECFSVVRPILSRRGIPCIFFLTEALVDNRALSPRHAISLCVEALLALGGARRREAMEGLAPILDPRAHSIEDLARWVLSPGRVDESALEGICLLLGVDTARYLAERAPYLTADQVRRMSAEGFVFGGHSRTHRRLQSLASDAERESEIVSSCEFVRGLTGQSIVPFAFPYSGAGVDRGLLKEIAAAYPFIRTFFDTQELRRDAPFVIHRVPLDSTPLGAARQLRAACLRRIGMP